MSREKYIYDIIIPLLFSGVFFWFFYSAKNAALTPTEYQINKGLEKVNNFIDKCNEPYKITIANSYYQFSCDAGYIMVESYILNAFNESK
ncbi:hypothetical protein H8R20_18115 [Morganella morganii]|uniref:hypothetical protein n=1 Tax=Morganella morganii TaxID=582 RepID=UPI001647E771|nr:hypothetical protein [Morganella morganii]MBC3997503.1 hypothetical protein [Morganella morganii]